ncbi:MAG TPA: TetR family transcriptional regulator [Polyangiaceae bacterium]|nr:TetR family transcriptional regulator [Polyangiaceae bacterium]
MSRPSNREQRRAELVAAFARVMSTHGYAGATIAAVAAEAGVAPGLVHHHFDDKADLLRALLDALIDGFRARTRSYDSESDPLLSYVDAALRLDERSDLVAAKCWVGVFAEAIRDPALFAQMRRLVDSELGNIRQRSGYRLSEHQAGCVLAFIIGSLVLGAFAPRKTAGFAAPGLRLLLGALR